LNAGAVNRLPALLSVLALAAGVGACGSDDAEFDAQPATTPDLVAPEDVTLARPSSDTTPAGASTTSTGATAATPATPPASGSSGGAAAPAEPATPAPSGGTPAPATPAPSTGNDGAGTGGATQPQGGGADPGGFSDFCAQNPGACAPDGN